MRTNFENKIKITHIKDDEKIGEEKILKDLKGSSKIEKKNPLYETFCKNEYSCLPGIGDSDICFQVDGIHFNIEIKSGKGNKNNGHINMNQIRLWKGEPIVLECSHSTAYNVDYCVFPANFLIRAALCGNEDFKIRPLHQEDILMSASMLPNPKKASKYFGCSKEELKNKIIEAQKEFENDEVAVEIVKRIKKRILNTVKENKEWSKELF